MRKNAEHEVGDGEPELVPVTLTRSTAPPGRMPARMPERDADEDGDEEAGQREAERHREPLADLLRDASGRSWLSVRLAEVELHRVAEPVAVALEHGSVEAELLAHLRDLLGRGVDAAGDGGGGVAGDELDEHEHDERHDEQHRDQAQEAPRDHPQHRNARSPCDPPRRIVSLCGRARPAIQIAAQPGKKARCTSRTGS